MCGIVGAVAKRNILKILIEGLKRLEYRGYDSAGVAYLNRSSFRCVREVGKVAKLADAMPAGDEAQVGIAHTRWATHGVPSKQNAHPHTVGCISLVHNGIIENHAELRAYCQSEGCEFNSETDSEVIAQLLNLNCQHYQTTLEALQATVGKLEGAYGVVVMRHDEPDRLYAIRSGSPLVLGLGFDENFISSDTLSLSLVTNRFIYLEEGDCAIVTKDQVQLFDVDHHVVTRKVHAVDQAEDVASRGDFNHFMQKEIFEQPQVLKTAISEPLPNGLAALLSQTKAIKIVACGTSYHAGLIAKYWFEDWAQLPCDCEIASEFRYRNAVLSPDTLFIVISQSGETADTLAALRLAKSRGLKTLAICNVVSSSMVREADSVMLTQAGTEIGVASTKAFTTQLVALYRLAANAAKSSHLRQLLADVPDLAAQMLKLDAMIKELAREFVDKAHCLFLGRGPLNPLAMEGALKLKEISYIHAESYAAGELKHGPLALVDKNMPVVAIAPNDELLEKLKANLQEVAARGGRLIVLTEHELSNDFMLEASFIRLPKVASQIAPIVYAIPLQLLAYHVAIIKGTDVDQPRNLAKSVTVE